MRDRKKENPRQGLDRKLERERRNAYANLLHPLAHDVRASAYTKFDCAYVIVIGRFKGVGDKAITTSGLDPI